MTTTTARTYQAGDPEPAIGTSVIRADGTRVTRSTWGWAPGPLNWVGILSQGPAVDDTPAASTVRYEVVDNAEFAAARQRAEAIQGGIQADMDDPETVCTECGWNYSGTYCDVCTPCDDCGLAPAACRCESGSVDTDLAQGR